MLYVFNKVDKVPNQDNIDPIIQKYQPHIIISATDKERLAPLIQYLSEWQQK